MFSGTPTPTLGLPQYKPCDHPDFLTDINKAFLAIDAKVTELQSSINEQALIELQANVTELTNTVQTLTAKVEELISRGEN